MHKYAVSFCVSGGDTNVKLAIMLVLTNNPRPTFNNGEDDVLLTMVLIAGTKLSCVVIPCGSIVLMVGITLAGAINPCGS